MVAIAPFALALFSLSVAGRRWTQARIVALWMAIVGLVSYYALMVVVSGWVRHDGLGLTTAACVSLLGFLSVLAIFWACGGLVDRFLQRGG
jgi:hypothetical protein